MPAVIKIKEKRGHLSDLLDRYGIIIKKQKAGNYMDDIFSAILDVGRGMLSDAVLALNAKTDRDDAIPRTRGDNPGR